MPSALSAVRARLVQAGLRPKKSWGQNFLTCPQTLADIVESVGAVREEPVIELGAGTGALTMALGEAGHRVLAVERDRDLVPLLSAMAAVPRQGDPPDSPWLEVLEADAARLDYRALGRRFGRALQVVGNLPYQLSGRILVSLAEQADAIDAATVMVQREVADRLLAEPQTKAFGLLTVLVRRRFDVHRIRLVPPGAFLPPPKVHSTVVALRRLPPASWPEPRVDVALVKVARAAFGSRRKTLRNTLETHLKMGRQDTLDLLSEAKIDGSSRAETLSMASFVALAAAYAARTADHPQ